MEKSFLGGCNVKKLCVVLILAAFLTGCGAKETFETVLDGNDVPAMAQMQQLELKLPEEAAVPSMENPDTGKLYLCDGYTLTVQTMDAGDLNRTLRQLTGYESSQLTLLQTKQGDANRYEFVWSAAGESGDQIGRAVVLDDGSYHYSVSVMAPADDSGSHADTWQEIFDSVKLVSTD